MLINKGKGTDPKMKQKNTMNVKELSTNLKQNINDNLKKPLSKLLESSSFIKANFSSENNHLPNSLKAIEKSTPQTNVINIRHPFTDHNKDKSSKFDNYFRNSDSFKKKTVFPREDNHQMKKSFNKNDNSDKNSLLTFHNTLNSNFTKFPAQNSIVSPLKNIKQISSHTNNDLTTNNTDILKDCLTLKKNTMEQSGDVAFNSQSLCNNNYKTISNNLKTISGKITPKSCQNSNFFSNNLKSNNNQNTINLFDRTIKIVQYNDENSKDLLELENINILNSIQQFGFILKSTNLSGNCIFSIDNLKKITILNEVLKALENENLDNLSSTSSKNQINNSKTNNNHLFANLTNNTHNLIKNPKTLLRSQKTILNTEIQRNGPSLRLFKLHSSIERQIIETRINESEDSNLASFSENKINIDNKKDLIISEIYRNSDIRIKRYRILFEFISTNISELKKLIISNKSNELGFCEDNNEINKLLNLNDCVEHHLKKKSSTSNEIDKIAQKINEDNNLMLSTISILNSTLKKHKEQSEKMINTSKNNRKLDNSENCNDSDIEENANIDEKIEFCHKMTKLKINEILLTNDKEIKKKRNNTDFVNVSISLIISSINSDFYKDLINKSFFESNHNLSLDKSDLKRDVILNNDFEQSIILESQIEVKSLIVSIDKTRENINLLDRGKLPQNINTNLDFYKKLIIPIKNSKLTSNPEVPLLDMYHSKCLSKDTVQISSKYVNSQGPNENKIDSNCIIS